MSEFEDPELRDRLGRNSGAFPDANAAYTVVVAKVGRARRRRAVVVSTTTTVVLIIAFLLGVGMRGRGDEARTLRPVDTSLPALDDGSTTSTIQTTTSITSTTSTSTSTSTSTTTLATTTSSSPSVPDSTVAPVPTDSTLPVVPAETVTTSPPADSGAITTTTKKRASPPANPPKRGTTRPTSPTTSTDPPDTNPVETSPPATDPPTTPPVVTQPPASDPPAQFETFTGIGGAITIRLEHGTMQVVDKVPSAGFIVGGNPDLSGAHVEVRFFSSSHFTKVHVDLVDGVMVSNGDERDSSGGTSGSPLATVGRIEHAPPSTDGDPSGDSSWHGGPG